MSADLGPEQVAKLIETVALVDANAQLLLADLRAAKLKAKQMEASLALVVGFLSECSDLDSGLVAMRVTEQLRLCANNPNLAAQTAGCALDHVDPAMLRAAAAVIVSAEPCARWSSPEQVATMH